MPFDIGRYDSVVDIEAWVDYEHTAEIPVYPTRKEELSDKCRLQSFTYEEFFKDSMRCLQLHIDNPFTKFLWGHPFSTHSLISSNTTHNPLFGHRLLNTDLLPVPPISRHNWFPPSVPVAR